MTVTIVLIYDQADLSILIYNLKFENGNDQRKEDDVNTVVVVLVLSLHRVEISGVIRQNYCFFISKEKVRGWFRFAKYTSPRRPRKRVNLLHNGQRGPIQEAQGYEFLCLIPLFIHTELTKTVSVPESDAEKTKKVKKVTAEAASVPDKKRKGTNCLHDHV
jgi:hypothetical protein